MNDSFRDPEERPGATVGGNVASTDLGTATAGVRVSGARKALHRMMWAVMGLMGPMITCRELTDFLAPYVEGGLTPQERKAFDGHVGMCRGCRDYVDSYVRTIELEGAAFADPDGPLPEDVPEELVHGILAARHAAG